MPKFSDDMDFNFESRKKLGVGSFGTVVKVLDEKTNIETAVKRIPNVLEGSHRTKMVIREILLLNALRSDHVISLLDVKLHSGSVYIMTEICDCSLHFVIYDPRQSFWNKRLHSKKYDMLSILYQLIKGIDFLHSLDILHRDIKPDNILLTGNLTVKICDFGLSRYVNDYDHDLNTTNEPLTEYMVTRWYRAPEIFLNPCMYGKQQDVWSVACVFSELIRTYPLFKGENSVDQIRVILNTLGKLSDSDLDFEMKGHSREFIHANQGNEGYLDFALYDVHDYCGGLYELLIEMLQFNPKKRITTQEAIMYPIFRSIRKQEQTNCSRLSSVSPLSFERINSNKWLSLKENHLKSAKSLDDRREILQRVTEEIHHGLHPKIDSPAHHPINHNNQPPISPPKRHISHFTPRFSSIHEREGVRDVILEQSHDMLDSSIEDVSKISIKPKARLNALSSLSSSFSSSFSLSSSSHSNSRLSLVSIPSILNSIQQTWHKFHPSHPQSSSISPEANRVVKQTSRQVKHVEVYSECNKEQDYIPVSPSPPPSPTPPVIQEELELHQQYITSSIIHVPRVSHASKSSVAKIAASVEMNPPYTDKIENVDMTGRQGDEVIETNEKRMINEVAGVRSTKKRALSIHSMYVNKQNPYRKKYQNARNGE